jgi:dienelactone hydrolase
MTGIRSWTTTCGGDIPAFFAVPDHTEKVPAVLVVHERYGFVRHTRKLAERFAGDGFVAVAPDLYFKHPDQEAVHRGDVICDVADPDALIALSAAIDALKAIPQADPARIAIMGVCQTGRLPLVVASSRPIAAALVWYGAAQPREWAVNSKYPRGLDEIIAAVDCPVLGMFGESDHLIAVDDIRRSASMSTATHRTAGSTTPCRGAIVERKLRRPGPTSAHSCNGFRRPATTGRRACSAMRLTLPSITISAATSGTNRRFPWHAISRTIAGRTSSTRRSSRSTSPIVARSG